MKTFLTPGDLARAIGVSESSLKRWADEGRLAVSRTAGGHRRIPLSEAVQFIRRSGAPLLDPAALGISGSRSPRAPRPGSLNREETGERLFQLLLRDDAVGSRALVVSLYLAGWGIDAIGDGPIREALRRVGELWRHDEQGVFIEHRATQTCLHALLEVRDLVRAPARGAGVALVAAPAGDRYLVPTVLAASVLADLGFADHNLGPETPWPALGAAITHYRPLLLSLSLSVPPADPKATAAGLADAADLLAPHGGSLVVGGRGTRGLKTVRRPNLHRGDSMAELAAFGRGVLATRRGGAAA